MPEIIGVYTSLLDAVNTGLSSLGETKVSSVGNPAPSVVLSKQIIEEVSQDVQSKGWWFNTGLTAPDEIDILFNIGGGASENFNSLLPEEARRYISIRAARVLQSRFLGSEELYKFSFQEEIVSYAVLTQAHVRNGGNNTSFTSFPSVLKSMGIEEFMFLQQSAEEKLLTIRLTTELNTAAKIAAETALIGSQDALVINQTATELQNAIKVASESGLITAQQALVSQQVLESVETILKTKAETGLISSQDALVVKQSLTEVETTLKVAAETTLLGSQDALVINQTATELQTAIKTAAESGLITAQQALVSQQVLESVATILKTTAETGLVSSQDDLVVKQTLTELENAIKVSAEAGLITNQQALVSQQVLESVSTTDKQTSEARLLDAQELLVDNQAATELKTTIKTQNEANVFDAQYKDLVNKTAVESAVEKSFYDGVVAGTQDTYRDYAAEMRMMGVQESTFQQFLAYKKIEVLKDAAKLRQSTLSTPPETASAAELSEVNKIMRFIGEPSANNLNKNSLMVEALRLLRDTNAELQGRGWWFNTETDVELTKETSFTVSGIGGHWHGLYTYNSVLDRYEHVQAGHTHYFSKTDSNSTNTVGTWSLSEEDPQGVFVESFDSNIGTGTWPDPALFEGASLSVDHVIEIGADVLYVEVEGVATFIKQIGGVSYLYDIKKKSHNLWPSNVSAKIIYQRDLLDLPQKFLEYLNVRVALVLTEMYPQSGADLQRLPKMEQELLVYFKDRDFDSANYTVFDNYDTATRIGINRNYNLF